MIHISSRPFLCMRPAAMSSRAELHAVMEADVSVLFVSEPRDLPCPWDCAAVKEDFFTAFFVLPAAMSSRAELHAVMEADDSVLFVSESRDLLLSWDCTAVKGNFFMAPISHTANYFLYPASARKARLPASRFTRKEAQEARMTWSRKRAHQVPISPMSST